MPCPQVWTRWPLRILPNLRLSDLIIHLWESPFLSPSHTLSYLEIYQYDILRKEQEIWNQLDLHSNLCFASAPVV